MTASTLPTVSKLPATPHLSLALLPDLAASLALPGLVGTTVKKKATRASFWGVFFSQVPL